MYRILEDGTIRDVIWDGSSRMPLTASYESCGGAAVQCIAEAGYLTSPGNHSGSKALRKRVNKKRTRHLRGDSAWDRVHVQ